MKWPVGMTVLKMCGKEKIFETAVRQKNAITMSQKKRALGKILKTILKHKLWFFVHYVSWFWIRIRYIHFVHRVMEIWDKPNARNYFVYLNWLLKE
jgi:hypothetical protein